MRQAHGRRCGVLWVWDLGRGNASTWRRGMGTAHAGIQELGMPSYPSARDVAIESAYASCDYPPLCFV